MSVNVSGGEQSGRRETVLAVAGLMLALFLVALDQTVVGTALPRIIADLDGFEHYAWVTTAYLLASTAMIPVIGKLGDIYGRKWFIISGVVIFLPASAPCSPSTGYCDPWRWKPFARASSATVPVRRISTTLDRHGKLPSFAPGEVSELAEGARLEIA